MHCASALLLQRRTASPSRVANDPRLHDQKPKARVFQKFRGHCHTHNPKTQEETRSLCRMSRGDCSLFQFSPTQKASHRKVQGSSTARTPFLSSLVSLRSDSQAPPPTLRWLEDLYSFWSCGTQRAVECHTVQEPHPARLMNCRAPPLYF